MTFKYIGFFLLLIAFAVLLVSSAAKQSNTSPYPSNDAEQETNGNVPEGEPVDSDIEVPDNDDHNEDMVPESEVNPGVGNDNDLSESESDSEYVPEKGRSEIESQTPEGEGENGDTVPEDAPFAENDLGNPPFSESDGHFPNDYFAHFDRWSEPTDAQVEPEILPEHWWENDPEYFYDDEYAYLNSLAKAEDISKSEAQSESEVGPENEAESEGEAEPENKAEPEYKYGSTFKVPWRRFGHKNALKIILVVSAIMCLCLGIAVIILSFLGSCAVRIYVIEDDTADAESEIANTKNFLSASAAYSITAADDAGTTASSITGVSWTQFAISRVEKYADPDSSDSKPWVQTTAGIAVLTVTGIIGALLIGGIIAYAIWYCRKPPTPPPRNRVEIGDDDGGDTVAKNKFDTRNNTMMTPNTSLLPYDKKQLPPAVVALPMPSAARRVPMQTGNKSIDKPKDINIFNASSQKPIFEKKPEKLRRSSPVPTETAYSPSSRFRTNSPFTQSEINYPSKRIPPMQRMPAQKPPRLDDSESTVPDYRSNLDESEYTGPKGKFDGRAVDPVSRRVYEYSTKTNERRWVTEPDGSLGKPVKLTRDDS